MKITLQSKPMLEALGIASKVISPRANLPALSCALIESHEGAMRVTCDSLEARITVDVPDADFNEPFRFLAPVRQLQYALRGETAELSIDKGRLIVVSGGRSSLGMLPVNEFPQTWTQVPRHGVDASEFIRALKIAENCCATNGGDMWQLQSVHFDPTCSRMIGCDRQMLGAAQVAMLMDEPFLLPANLASVVLGAFGSSDNFTIGVSGGVFCVSAPGKTVWARLMEGEYPKYQQVIPVDGDRMTMNREELQESLRSLSGFLDAIQRVDVTQAGGSWLMTACANGHESSATVSVQHGKGARLTPFSFIASKMLGVIRYWDCDTIDVMQGERGLLLRPVGQENPMGVVSLLADRKS